MRIIFEKMDKDGSGHIDEFELANFLSVFAGYLKQPVPNQKQVKMLYKLLDADLDGKISYQEIREVLCQIIKIVENKFNNEYEILQYEGILKDKEKLDVTLKELFEEFDADGSGQIDKKELYTLLIAVSEQFDIDPPSQEDVELVLSNLDENSDNLLDYKEMRHFLEAILEELIDKRKEAIDRENSEQEDSAYVQFSYNQIL